MKIYQYGDNVDTDVIIPARFLNESDPAALAKHCMEDIDPAFAGTVKPGDLIIAGENFGCGSSREHAPLAIKASGIGAVVAKSFARIFFRNAVNTGLTILECPAAVDAIGENADVKVDTVTGTVAVDGVAFKAQPIPPFIHEIIRAGGLLASLAADQKKTASYDIVLLPGDGIGPEITQAARTVMERAAELYGFGLRFTEQLIGGRALDTCGLPLPHETLESCKRSDAVFLGAVGGPQWDNAPVRPEKGLLELREGLNLYNNLRPVKLWNRLAGRRRITAGDWEDYLIVRELTGGLYFGAKGRRPGGSEAYDTCVYSAEEIDRILRFAFEAANQRRKKLTSVDKANVLETSRLWRERAELMSEAFPDVELAHMLVDNAAMQIILNPAQFDVIVTENTFGDILSDEAGAAAGSVGLMPSASLGGRGTPGVFEPIHGSAPELAGKDAANPLASILSAAMLLRYGLDEPKAADAIERAVGEALDGGARTADIAEAGENVIGTKEMTRRVLDALR